MVVSSERAVLAEAWAAELRRDGHVEVGTMSQPRLLALGVHDIVSGEAERRVVETSFERLDADDQRLALEHAKADSPDDQLAKVVGGVMTNPTIRGTWMMTPPWFEPLSHSPYFRMYGMVLPDGSAGVMEAVVDPPTSQFVITVRTVADQAARLAAHFFEADPPPPSGAAAGWTDEHGGGLSQLTNVWPKGRGTRALTWRITRTTSASPMAFLQARRDFGLKRSVDATVDQAMLALRLQEMLEQSTAEGSGHP